MKKEFIDFDSLVIKYLSSLDLKDQTINEYEKILKDFIKYWNPFPLCNRPTEIIIFSFFIPDL